LQLELADFQRQFAAALDRPASGGMAVYRNTVIHGAVEALRANYPVVEQIIGPEMFEHVAVDFVSTCPPTTAVLALYGAEFADWLRHQSWIADLPYLSDVARVERLHLKSLFAPDYNVLRADQGLAIRLHPAVSFGWLSTPAMSIWLSHQQSAPSEIAPEWTGEGALFTRPEPFTTNAARTTGAAHRLLTGLRLGETLGASIAAAAGLFPEEDCASVFASLVNLGVFAAPSRTRN